MPTPPDTLNAPVIVLEAAVIFVIDIILVVEDPLFVILCKVLVFHIRIDPVDVETAVSVPAVIATTLCDDNVAVVTITALLTYPILLTYNAPPIPTPPTTCNAPVVVLVETVVL